MSDKNQQRDKNQQGKKEKITVLLLGGYGNTGRILAKLLLLKLQDGTAKNTNNTCTIDHLIIAGRNLERAQDFVQELQRLILASSNKNTTSSSNDLTNHRQDDGHNHNITTPPKVSALQIDAADPPDRWAAVLVRQQVTLMVVASSSASCMRNLASAALYAKVDVMDLLYSRAKTNYLQRVKADIEKVGCCFITDCGFHPGLPAVLIRYTLDDRPMLLGPTTGKKKKLESAKVSSVIRVDWKNLSALSPETLEDFAAEFADFSTLTYKDGHWKEEGFMKPMNVNFGPPFGNQPCIPMYLEELKDLPSLYPALKETGFYVGGLNWAVDWIISPIVLVALKLWPNNPRVRRAMGRLLHWGLVTFSKPPYGTLLRVEAKDATGQQQTEMTISHKDGYALTAMAVAATIEQYLDRNTTTTLRRPGLWLQGSVVEPTRLLKSMEDMGLTVHYPSVLGQINQTKTSSKMTFP